MTFSMTYKQGALPAAASRRSSLPGKSRALCRVHCALCPAATAVPAWHRVCLGAERVSGVLPGRCLRLSLLQCGGLCRIAPRASSPTPRGSRCAPTANRDVPCIWRACRSARFARRATPLLWAASECAGAIWPRGGCSVCEAVVTPVPSPCVPGKYSKGSGASACTNCESGRCEPSGVGHMHTSLELGAAQLPDLCTRDHMCSVRTRSVHWAVAGAVSGLRGLHPVQRWLRLIRYRGDRVSCLHPWPVLNLSRPCLAHLVADGWRPRGTRCAQLYFGTRADQLP